MPWNGTCCPKIPPQKQKPDWVDAKPPCAFRNPDEMQQLLMANHETRWYPLWFWLMATGTRLGEALALRWDAIDEAKGTRHDPTGHQRRKSRSLLAGCVPLLWVSNCWPYFVGSAKTNVLAGAGGEGMAGHRLCVHHFSRQTLVKTQHVPSF